MNLKPAAASPSAGSNTGFSAGNIGFCFCYKISCKRFHVYTIIIICEIQHYSTMYGCKNKKINAIIV